MFDNTTLYRLPDLSKAEQLAWLWPAPVSFDTLMVVDGSQWTIHEQETATKLIQAILLDQTQAAVVALRKDQTIHLSQLRKQFHFQRVIALGIPPHQLMLQAQVKRHQLVNMEDLSLVFGYDVATMNDKTAYKTALWQVLQQLYNL